jgi:glyoxylate/hydroxypyruvate reductase A
MTGETERRKGRVLLATSGFDNAPWIELLGRRREVVTELADPADPSIHYAVVWKQAPGLLVALPNLKAIFSVGAGVDHLLADPTLPDVPIVRVVDANLSTHMSEYVCWRVLDHHRRGRAYRALQAARDWQRLYQPVAEEVAVGIMGFGELGRATAKRLLALGFRVLGWSRTGAAMEGVRTFAGPAGLDPFLAATDFLVVLLPLTAQTEGVIDYELLSRLRRDGSSGGPVLINAGRGRLQKEVDILRALDDGTLREASLDVFETEPLAQDSPLWSHPGVFITPHAAADSDPVHLVPPMLDQMDACDRGEPLKNLVDRTAGY